MDVPDIMLKFTLLLSMFSKLDGPASLVQPAKIFTPGAITSGFKISGVIGFGPRLENAATRGADIEFPVTVPLKISVAVAEAGWDLR